MDGGGTPPTFPCPKCGYQLGPGTPICGNCGTIQGGGTGGGTHVPEPLAAAGIKPGAVIAALLVVGLAAGLFFARGAISDAFDSVGDAVDEATRGGADDPGGREIGGGGGGSDEQKPAVPIAYRRVEQVVRDIRAGGIPCTDTRVDGADRFVQTGSCQSNGSHVQINLYFEPASLKLAREFYAEFAFASVHADNWWVSGETSLMARIQKVLGGRLKRP
ncbi:MAG TPA: hypothetical protein VG318_05960 [Actinomycetota bacterium]|nr:hypothetical protein [Actinomycetota bacterium]